MQPAGALRVLCSAVLLGVFGSGCAPPPTRLFPPTSQWQCFRGSRGGREFSFWYPPGPWRVRSLTGRVVFGPMPFTVEFHLPDSLQRGAVGKYPLIGSLVATQGPVWVTAALSEVYDFQASFFLGDSLSEVLFKALPAITPTTFCQLLHRERFLDPVPPQLRGIAPRGLRGMLRLDGRYRHDPRVVLCDSQDSIVTFDETFLQAIGPRFLDRRIHCFGAIRFLRGPISSVHFVVMQIDAPPPEMLEAIRQMVRSFSNAENPPLPPWDSATGRPPSARPTSAG